MNFDNGQALKFGVSNYGQGLANAAGVCHFQYMGMGETQAGMKPAQGVQGMQVDRNTFVPQYHNVGMAHHQGNPAAQGYPVGVSMTMSSPMSFSALPPMESFGHNQGFAGANQRPNMNYKNFNNWMGHTQNNHTALPSIGHLWSHFQQQQMQKHQVPPPQQQQQQQPQQQQPQPQPPHQQNYYPNQQHMQGFQTLALSPNMAPRPQNIGYQFQAQNPVVNHSRMYQPFTQERMQNCIYGNQNPAVVSQNIPIINDPHLVKTQTQQVHPGHMSGVAGPRVTAICNQVTKPTTTITMTNCNSTSLSTAMVHVNVTVPSVVTSVTHSAGSSPAQGAESERPVSASSCGTHPSKPRIGDGADSESAAECDQESVNTKQECEPSLQIVKVPFGWRRTTENGAVVYYSPSGARLCSFHEVCKYLSAEGTCKCGLECPLLVEKVFSFDPLVNGKLWTVDDMASEDLTQLCIHKRKIIAMATFQSSRSIPVAKNSQRKSGNSRKGKRKSKANCSTTDSNEGLRVPKLLIQKGKIVSQFSHIGNQPSKPPEPQNLPTPEITSQASESPGGNTVPKMFDGQCKSQAMQQLQQLKKVNNIAGGNKMADPMDDLGPITCQVPAKLDFSKEGFLEDQKNRLQNSMAGHPVGQAMFQGAMSPQAQFGQDQMKHQVLLQQSVSPCAPNASPSLVNSAPNHMYGPNIPQHFQCQLPMNMQQGPGNIMFQALMQVQNAPTQRFTNPPVFEQTNMQGNHLQVGSQPNIMMNQAYPQLTDLAWLDPGKPKVKRPRSKKDKQKLNSILDRTSPCPNVDVRHISQVAPKNPSSVTTSVSFMENPAAFLAQQTALVHSSLSSTNTDMSQQSPKQPQPPGSSSQCTSNVSAPVTTSTVSEPNQACVLSDASSSISQKCATSTSILTAGNSSGTSGSARGDDNANCDRGTSDGECVADNSLKDVSSTEECCDDKTGPANNNITSAKPKTKGISVASDASETKIETTKSSQDQNLDVSQQSQAQPSTTITSAGDATTVANTVMPNNISELIAANNLNIGTVQQAMGQQTHADFPASTLLSAAARAQVSQQNPLNLLLGQPMQVNPALQVSAGQESINANNMTEMMAKAGVNPLDQLHLLQQQGAAAGTLMLPPNPNILAGALPAGYINTLNGPTMQGLPLNMFLPLNQTLGNTTGVNPAQNVLIGLDPKSGSSVQTTKQTAPVSRVSESNKGMEGLNGPTGNLQTVYTNIAGVPSTIGANMKLTTTPTNTTQVSAGVSAPLMNSQFPFVTMNTPMPPMSLPIVTNVTNSLSQVIPAVGVPQAVLNQQQVAPLLSTVTVPTLNNSVVITNQLPSVQSTQPGPQNIAFMGVQPTTGSDTDTASTSAEDSGTGTMTSSGSISETMCASDSNTVSGAQKLDGSAQGVETLVNKLVTHQGEVVDQLGNNQGQVVLLPNPNVPLLQLYGANPLMAASGMDKFGMQQVMLPQMIDPQLCQSQAAAAAAAVGGPLNLLQMQQQMWNGTGNGNLTNMNAIQLQALQLQFLLQQIQGMQSLVNQIQLQGAAQQAMNPDPGQAPAEVAEAGEAEEDDVKVEAKDEELESPDGESSPIGECEVKSECDNTASKDSSVEPSPERKILATDIKRLRDSSPESDSGNNNSKSLIKEKRLKKSESVYSSKGIGNDTKVLHNNTGHSLDLKVETSSYVSPGRGVVNCLGRESSEREGGTSSGEMDGSITSMSELNHNGPDDLCDDTDSMDDDISLDDLRRGLKRARTDDETDSTSYENFDGESIDGLLPDDYINNFSTGDVVWGQIRGFPLWPGKLVPDSAAEGIELSPSLEDKPDAVLVMWYGDHTFTRVEPQRLKSWLEGLEVHHKTRKKSRRGRKMNSHLEAAIQEAARDVKDLPIVASEPCLPVRPVVKGRSSKKKKA